MVKSLPEHSVIDKMEKETDIRLLREARGLTLDDVFKATKISVKNLEAMENGDFHRLPPPIYTKAYFKSYAQLLGVDERLITGSYENNLNVSAQAVEEEEEETPEKNIFFSQKIIINAAAVLVLCVLGFFSYIYFNVQEADITLDRSLSMNPKGKAVTDITNSAVSTIPATEDPVDVGNGAAGKSLQSLSMTASASSKTAILKSEETTAAIIKTPVEKPILIIVAREKTWLRITEGQKEAYELLMAPGERIERSSLQYNIDIGNAGGVSVQFQGTIMNTLGKSGEVVHLRLP